MSTKKADLMRNLKDVTRGPLRRTNDYVAAAVVVDLAEYVLELGEVIERIDGGSIVATWQTVPPAGRVAEPDPGLEAEPGAGLVSIRNVDARIWRDMRMAARKRGITLGAALNEAMAKWLNVFGQTGHDGD